MNASQKSQLHDEGSARSLGQRSKSFESDGTTLCCEPGCCKSFQRPCDLTKHKKTHSRPWKCPELTCEYHTLGWPSEAEMSRHFRDRHSAAPPMYQCLYSPCTYRSKRESNCKKHMEKTHGWYYKRTKKIGKGSQLRQLSPIILRTNSYAVPPTIPISNPPSLPNPDSEDILSTLSPNSTYVSVPEGNIAPPMEVPTSHGNQTFHASLVQSQKCVPLQLHPHTTELEVLRISIKPRGRGLAISRHISTLEGQLQVRGGDEQEQMREDIEQEMNQDHAAKRLCTDGRRARSSVNDWQRASTVRLTTAGSDDCDNTISSSQMGKSLPEIIVDPNDVIAVKCAQNTMAARKSRQRKQRRFEDLEKEIQELRQNRDYWKGIAMSPAVTRGSEA